MNRCRFSIPNDIWKWNLKPQGFAILVYLHYLHVHCKNFIAPSADEIASQLHMSKDMAAKQIAELNRRGLLDQHMVPMLESNGKNFFSLPNELFFMNIGHPGISNQKSSRKRETSPVVLHASIVYYFYLLVVNPEQS